MGHNDYLDDGPELPPEAGNVDGPRFEPNDDWLRTAPRNLQIRAMRRWFLDRYEDPQNETPYDSEDGGYVFVWGGPYDPNDVIQERFDHVVPFKVMRALIDELYVDVGDEWAPIDHEGADYDDALSMLVVSRTDPHRMLSDRLAQIEAVLTVAGDVQLVQLTTQLAHGAAITALEAYLWDTVAYWAANDESVVRAIVATSKDFQAKTLPLSTIFERMERLKDEVENYLRDMVWHRLDKVKPLMTLGLKIEVPDIGELMEQIVVRHDIVHRGGRNKDGRPVNVSVDDVCQLLATVRAFVDAIELELERRFPPPADSGVGVHKEDF